jgi:predicted nucleic acid-binding Zn ribbon protein
MVRKMRRKSATSLSSLLSGVIDDLGVSKRLDETNVEEAWRSIAGPQVARVTNRVRMRDGRLTIFLTDAAWRHALHAERPAWMRRVNEALGRDVVKEILFR